MRQGARHRPSSSALRQRFLPDEENARSCRARNQSSGKAVLEPWLVEPVMGQSQLALPRPFGFPPKGMEANRPPKGGRVSPGPIQFGPVRAQRERKAVPWPTRELVGFRPRPKAPELELGRGLNRGRPNLGLPAPILPNRGNRPGRLRKEPGVPVKPVMLGRSPVQIPA